MIENIAEIKNVSKQFLPHATFALEGINASIPKGKLVGLVGPDGAGKTTLIRIIAGLLAPSNGSVTVANNDTLKNSEIVHYFTGYMPQKFGLYEDLSVYQNLKLYAELRNLAKDERQETFEKLLQFTNLKAFKERLARNLSGGMKQKLGLACSLVKKPKLLLLDEPTVGVDPISRRELWDMVGSLLKEGISVLWSTAYLDEAEKCDSVLLLNSGKLLFSGDPKELTKKLDNRVYTISPESDRRKVLFELLQDDNIIDGVIQGGKIRVVKKEIIPLENLGIEEKVLPRFEDAFIDILGGGPKGTSKLAQIRESTTSEKTTPVSAKNLSKIFGKFRAVDDISIEIKEGEIFGLLGPNGAGKTTTFKMLCGLLKPTFGEALINGVNLQKAPDLARMKIGYMAQKFSLYGNLSVQQNLEFFAGIYNLKNRMKEEAIQEMVKIFKLDEYLDISADTLPLGYKQRLALACANMHKPKILFLDEPTSGVDPITRREFWNHINGLVSKGVTVMITTHFMDEAEYCDRIALVFQGKIIQLASPSELKDQLKSEKNPNPTLEDAFIEMMKDHGEGAPSG